jgi:salicylate hydroxylase
MTSNLPFHNPLHVGLCGGGLGGLAAAIALRRAGAQVTVLEAASELGEIGAGIQMTPNASRLLIKWGVADIIGENLVEVEELNLRRRNCTVSVQWKSDRNKEGRELVLTEEENRIYEDDP